MSASIGSGQIRRVMVPLDLQKTYEFVVSQGGDRWRELVLLIDCYKANVEELERVNQALHDAGIDHPQGARGVEDLAHLHQSALEGRREAQHELSEYKKAHPE